MSLINMLPNGLILGASNDTNVVRMMPRYLTIAAVLMLFGVAPALPFTGSATLVPDACVHNYTVNPLLGDYSSYWSGSGCHAYYCATYIQGGEIKPPCDELTFVPADSNGNPVGYVYLEVVVSAQQLPNHWEIVLFANAMVCGRIVGETTDVVSLRQNCELPGAGPWTPFMCFTPPSSTDCVNAGGGNGVISIYAGPRPAA